MGRPVTEFQRDDARTWPQVVEADDVTPEILAEAVEIVDGWYMDCPFDWEDFFSRLESSLCVDTGSQWDTPAIKKIQAAARKAKREAQA